MSTQGFIVDIQPFLYDLVRLSVRRFGYENAVQVQLRNNAKRVSQFFQYSLDGLGQGEVVLTQQSNALLANKVLYQMKLAGFAP